jgi:glycosyltransferase involved in cell wall biosynthesis
VHDGIEHPEFIKESWDSTGVSLTAALVTSQHLDHLPVIRYVPPWLNIRIVGQYQLGLQKFRNIWWHLQNKTNNERISYLQFLMNHHIKCVPWGRLSVYRELLDSDIGIIPIASDLSKPRSSIPPEWMLKSANRLTLKMSVGLPVIATPIPAYESVIIHGHNGLFARSPRDWDRCLKLLRDPDLRREIGTSARNSVESKFSIQEQARLFLNVVKSVVV